MSNTEYVKGTIDILRKEVTVGSPTFQNTMLMLIAETLANLADVWGKEREDGKRDGE